MKEISRLLYPILKNDFQYEGATILIGARQVGKTHLMKKLYHDAGKTGLNTTFYDLEQPETLLMFNKPDQDIIRFLTDKTDMVFLDEFYYFKNATKVFKAIYDKGRQVKIFASGSSSLQIHKHLKESLAGRKRVFHVLPCGFNEMEQLWDTECLQNIVRYGGLPGITRCRNSDEIILLLSDIHQSYIMKDIKSLINEENIRAFNHLVYLLAERQGSMISVLSLSREIGLTSKTVENYLNILSQTGVLHPVTSYSKNMGNELKKSRKYYLYDLGVRNMIVKDFRPAHKREDAGFLYESFVCLELQRMMDPVSEVRFWRTKDGKEVDFIFIYNRIPYPVEVKIKAKAKEIPIGLASFLRRYPKTPKAFIFNLYHEGEQTMGKTKIYYKKFPQITQFKQWIE